MEAIITAVFILYLMVRLIALKSALGGLIGYMATKEYPIPTEEELAEWSRWYIKKHFGVDSEKLPTDKSV